MNTNWERRLTAVLVLLIMGVLIFGIITFSSPIPIQAQGCSWVTTGYDVIPCDAFECSGMPTGQRQLVRTYRLYCCGGSCTPYTFDACTACGVDPSP